jgi:hypothetical protein
MKNKLLLAVILLIQLNSLKLWFYCRDLADTFHFSTLDMQLKLQEAISNDVGFEPLIVRIFHNKVIVSINEIFKQYIHFFDIRFGAMFFSLVGYFGIVLGFYYLIKVKMRYRRLVLAFFLLLPFLEVFRLISNFQIRFIVLVVPYVFLSVFGLSSFLVANKKGGAKALVMLIIVSIWYQFILQSDISINCFN